MANATAPLTNETKYQKEKDALAQEFSPNKKYMFQLAEENLQRELPVLNMRTNRPVPHQKFKPFQNIVLTSQIVWEGQRRGIRYYDGCTTIFIDEQPKDKETVDQLIKQTQRRNFLDGKFGCHGDERMLLLYLNICSWNAESTFRTRSANAIFVPVNVEKKATAESDRLDKTEEALKLAKEASEMKMKIHASYIGIPVVDYDSGNELTEKEIRAEYRKEALNNPIQFIKDYGDKSLEAKFYIEEALKQKLISTSFNPNKATWGKNNTVICDISGLRTPEAITEKLLEFSQLEDGAEFAIQLKSLFNTK